MTAVAVRYRVHPGRAEENAALVRAVYRELAQQAPEGFRYATFVEADGVSFVHVAVMAPGVEAPLTSLASFRAFRAGLDERCEEGPVSTPLTPVGGYGW